MLYPVTAESPSPVSMPCTKKRPIITTACCSAAAHANERIVIAILLSKRSSSFERASGGHFRYVWRTSQTVENS